MTRAAASNLDDIASMHGCAARTDNPVAPPDVPEYMSTLLAPNGDCNVRDTLRQLFDKVRWVNEVEEVYVRPIGTGTFEPLVNAHFSSIGALALVLRRRHPHADPRIVGVMLAKDEADVIRDVLVGLRPHLDALYYHVGDQATQDVFDSLPPEQFGQWARRVHVPDCARGDGMRRYLLEQARADAVAVGDRRPMWVMSVQGDEIYHDDLRHHVRMAHRELATVMNCQVATFLLHKSQQTVPWEIGGTTALAPYWTLPLERRLTHYIWDFGEHAGFLDYPWIHYNQTEHMRAHPHGLYPGRWSSARPVRKHYPFRSPEQARARIADRLKSGWQPHYKNYEHVFMGDTAAGRQVKPYFGWFPEAERSDGIW